jgi:hypothetical protein
MRVFGESTQGFLNVAQYVRNEVQFPELILVGSKSSPELVVLEGHVRLTSFFPHQNLFRKRSMLSLEILQILRKQMNKFILLLFGIFVCLLLSSCAPQIPEISGTAYYIDCMKGDDNNAGTSSSQAWGSLDKINRTHFQPGDGIFFKRDTTCQGVLTPQGSGKKDHPIIMGAYGRGALPIIEAGDHPEAFKLVGQEYWEIQDLEITGGTQFGVLVSGIEGGDELKHIRLTNLVVHDVWGDAFVDKTPGLVVVLSNGSLFKNVVIDGVTAYNTNQWAGIEVSGSTGWPIDYDNPEFAEDVIVRNSTVYNVYGDGIVLWGVQNGLIEYSVAYDTGQQPSPQTIGTPSSIWTWSCYDCVVQYNESYNASSPNVDAGCYDIDWGTRNNTFQYNYGHDCDGYCLSVFGAGDVTTEDAIARYNVCANNGRSSSLASRQGDFYLSTWGGGHLDGVLIHNNTSYWDPEGNYPALVNSADFTGDRRNIFANNIVVSTAPWMIDGGSDLELDHNLYWLDGEGDPFFYFDKGYYMGFPEYQNLSGYDIHSIFADPHLNDPTYHEIGAPKEAFTLQEDSTAIDAGFDLKLMGATDFFGNSIPFGSAYDIGAHEWSPEKRGEEISRDLAAILGSLSSPITESKVLLVGLINPKYDVSRSQVVFLRSMARQFAESGLQVMLVDVSGLSDSELINLSQSWHLGDISLMGKSLNTTTPTTLLFNDGILYSHWEGMVLPIDFALTLQKILQ